VLFRSNDDGIQKWNDKENKSDWIVDKKSEKSHGGQLHLTESMSDLELPTNQNITSIAQRVEIVKLGFLKTGLSVASGTSRKVQIGRSVPRKPRPVGGVPACRQAGRGTIRKGHNIK
jgi:hypothetical protein